jgi:lysophospholipase L1-like esterase
MNEFDVVATFGDSWPEGGELEPSDSRYGELLQKKFGAAFFFNYGSAGASNEDMLFQLQDFLEQHQQLAPQTLAIFHLTNPARTAYFPRFLTWDIDRSWPDATKDHLKSMYLHFHNLKHEIMRSSSVVTTLQSWCRQFGIRDYYFSGWVKYSGWQLGVDLDKIYKTGQETAADWFGADLHNGEHLIDVSDNPYIRPNFCHPNQLGHEMIATRLHDWITNHAKYWHVQ